MNFVRTALLMPISIFIDGMVWVYRPGAVKVRNFATICQVRMYHTEMFGFIRSKYSKVFPKFTKRVIGLLTVIHKHFPIRPS